MGPPTGRPPTPGASFHVTPRRPAARGGRMDGKEMVILGGFTERTFPTGVTRGVISATPPPTTRWPAPGGACRRCRPRGPMRPRCGTDATCSLSAGGSPLPAEAASPQACSPTGVDQPLAAVASDAARACRLAAVWTGSRLLVWGGTVERGGASVAPQTTLSFNPTANAWTVLAPSPVAGRTTRGRLDAAGDDRGGRPLPGGDPAAAALTP